MANWISIRIIYILVLVTLNSACDQEGPSLPVYPGLTPEESLIARDWRYRDLMINGDTLNVIVSDFEPSGGIDDWLHVKFRWFRYATNKSYEFRGGTIGGDAQSPNYQPTFGYWKVNEAGDSLIHNEYESYKTKYFIVHISDTLFIREYERIVMETSDSLKWPLGDTVVYREVFVPRDQ